MNRIAIAGSHGVGKCLSYGELMRLADGSLVPVESLIGKTFDVLAIDEHFNIVKTQAFAEDNGIKPIVQIITDRGRIIRRTPNHPLWGDVSPYRLDSKIKSKRLRPQGGWVEAKDIKKGSVVAVYSGNEGANVKKPEAHIKLLAYLLADGGLTGKTQIGIFSKEERAKDIVDAALNVNQHNTQKWRKFGLPQGFMWERVKSAELLKTQMPTVAIYVPIYHTFLTDFVEHNSTLCRQLSESLLLPRIDEVARTVAEGWFSDSNAIKNASLAQRTLFQLSVFFKQIQEEDRYPEFISDRSIFDVIAYSKYYELPNKVIKMLKEEAVEQSKEYDLIIYCPIPEVKEVVADGFRFTDKESQVEIDRILQELLKEAKCEVFRLGKYRETWLGEVTTFILINCRRKGICINAL